ncbi:choice-of-anchor D domain-containing protein [candidate division KSB1 bacterium]|nr:choice-of-anchor D domain-containing protein [candidate division KSB1 bacterium]
MINRNIFSLLLTITLLCIFAPAQTQDLNVYQEGTLIPNKTGSYDFGTISAPPVDRVFELRNESSTSIEINSIIITNDTDNAFSVLNIPNDPIPAYNNDYFTVRFDPPFNGTFSGIINISYQGSAVEPQEYLFEVTGRGNGLNYSDIELETNLEGGGPPGNLIPDGGTYDLGTRSYYDPDLQAYFLIKSTGYVALGLPTNPVEISGPNASEFDLVTSSFPTSIQAGEYFNTQVMFRPTSVGNKEAYVAVANDSRDHSPTCTFTYTAFVQGAILRLQQASTQIPHNTTYDYGTIAPGIIMEVTFTIYNDGNINLVLNAPQVTPTSGLDEYWVTQNPVSPVVPGGNTTFKIAFTPLGTGSRTATVTIANNASPDPYSFTLRGQSSEPTVSYDFNYRGWYLISLPVTPDITAIKTIFAAVTPYNGYKYSAEAGTNGAYESITHVPASEAGTGFWIFVDTPGTVNVSGSPIFSYTKNLVQGWYTLGSTILECDPAGNPAKEFADNYFPHMLYDGTGVPYYSIAAFFAQTVGYWVYAYGTCDLSAQASNPSTETQKSLPGYMIASELQLTPPPPPSFDLLAAETETEEKIPATFEVYQNYPNPFNPTTLIRYDLPQTLDVSIMIYNTRGEKVKTLLNRSQRAGSYSAVWDGSNELGVPTAAGLYFIRIKAGHQTKTIKVLYVR